MKVGKCFHRKILNPCSLEAHNYQVDPYIGCEHFCRYCYALNKAETDWEKEILIHENFIKRLTEAISSLDPQDIYMGMNSDPYQPSERTFKQTRKALDVFAKRGFSVSLLTKSGLVTRDIDLFAKMPKSSVGVSLAFQKEQTRHLFEKNAPSNKERIEALKRLKGAGIKTYTLICPVMPFVTNVESLIELVAPYSDKIWIYKLEMESTEAQNWQNVESILNQNFPELTEKYRKIAFSGDYPYWRRLRQRLEEIQSKKYLNLRIEL
ncbi:radical SAM protein [candidate division WOR-3 bacterium]|nr:radical SAM protein [candidate division WOR-3 bacterium]